jgi:hypothetical protein
LWPVEDLLIVRGRTWLRRSSCWIDESNPTAKSPVADSWPIAAPALIAAAV